VIFANKLFSIIVQLAFKCRRNYAAVNREVSLLLHRLAANRTYHVVMYTLSMSVYPLPIRFTQYRKAVET